MGDTWIRWYDTLSLGDVALVGSKNASLGETRRTLVPLDVPVPNGFATTADAYRAHLREGGLEGVIDSALSGLDVRDPDRLREAGRTVRDAIVAAELPPAVAEEVRAAYRELEAEYGAGCDVAVRSSATSEDLAEASFDGYQQVYFDVRGAPALLDAVRRCMASLFTDRAIVYRAERGIAHAKVALSVGVQKMVRSAPLWPG
jgi:pyruvate, water dikinase